MEKIGSITERTKNWKKFFVENSNLKGFDETSLWASILEKTDTNTFFFLTEASRVIGDFDREEDDYLRSLPFFQEAIESVLKLAWLVQEDGKNFGYGRQEGVFDVCYIYRDKVDIDLFECFIVSPETAEELKTDLLMNYLDLGLVICLSFVKEVPEGFEIKE